MFVKLFKNHPVTASSGLFAIMVFIFSIVKIEPVLYYHELQPDFLTNRSFFFSYLGYPGGLSEYVSQFLTQFFYFNFLGALIISLLGIIFVAGGSIVIKKLELNPIYTLLFLIPYMLFVVQFSDYHFPLSSAIELLMAFGSAILFWQNAKSKITYFIYPIFALALYYIADNGAFLTFIILSSIIVFYQQKFKKGLIFSILALIFYFSISKLAYSYVFNISPARLWFNFIPDTATLLMFRTEAVFHIFTISILTVVLLLFAIRKLGKTVVLNRTWLISISVAIIVFSTTIITYNKLVNNQLKNTIAADYYCYKGNWNKVIEIAGNNREYNVKINTLYNIAIDQTDQLFEKFFDYPQLLGPGILYPDLLSTPEMAMISSDFYYNLGYISESLHWAHEAQTSQPFSMRILKKMVLLNIIDKNYLAADKYLNVLDQNILAKDFVKKYKPYISDTTLAANDFEIMEKRSFSPKGKTVANIFNKLNDLVDANKKNKKAYDYLILFHMLDHNLIELIRLYPDWKKFYLTNPSLVDAAMLIFHYQNNNMKNLKGFSESEVKKLTDYLNLLSSYNNDVAAAKQSLSREYSNTYMYYLMYNSPRETKISYSADNITNYNR